MREGEKRRGPSAHFPAPRAQHPNPRSRAHAKPPERDGEKWMTPFHTPQAESGGLRDGDSHKIYIPKSHKPHRVHAKTQNILHTYCVGHRERGGWQRRNSMALHREENKVPLYTVAEVQTEYSCPKYELSIINIRLIITLFIPQKTLLLMRGLNQTIFVINCHPYIHFNNLYSSDFIYDLRKSCLLFWFVRSRSI